MKLKINMYVRVKEFNYTIIAKITKVDRDGFNCDNNMYYMEKDAIKASDNIIELIQKDDYVNGGIVCDIAEDENGKTWIYTDSNYKYGILSDEIEDIMTKEQFDKMKYIVH